MFEQQTHKWVYESGCICWGNRKESHKRWNSVYCTDYAKLFYNWYYKLWKHLTFWLPQLGSLAPWALGWQWCCSFIIIIFIIIIFIIILQYLDCNHQSCWLKKLGSSGLLFMRHTVLLWYIDVLVFFVSLSSICAVHKTLWPLCKSSVRKREGSTIQLCLSRFMIWIMQLWYPLCDQVVHVYQLEEHILLHHYPPRKYLKLQHFKAWPMKIWFSRRLPCVHISIQELAMS